MLLKDKKILITGLANKYSTSEVGRLLYEQRYINLGLILDFWETDGSRFRTNSEITELCKKKLKEDSNFSKH